MSAINFPDRGDAVAALIQASTRSNGRRLLSQEAAGLLTGKSLPEYPEQRRVAQDLTVNCLGQHWDLSPARFWPGDLVLCLPTRRGVYLRIQDPHKVQPDILVGRVRPLHSPRRTAHTPDNAPHSGTPTTFASAHSVQAGRQQNRHQSPQQSTVQDNKQRRRQGSAHGGPAGSDSATVPAHPTLPCFCCCKQCIHRPRLP